MLQTYNIDLTDRAATVEEGKSWLEGRLKDQSLVNSCNASITKWMSANVAPKDHKTFKLVRLGIEHKVLEFVAASFPSIKMAKISLKDFRDIVRLLGEAYPEIYKNSLMQKADYNLMKINDLTDLPATMQGKFGQAHCSPKKKPDKPRSGGGLATFMVYYSRTTMFRNLRLRS